MFPAYKANSDSVKMNVVESFTEEQRNNMFIESDMRGVFSKAKDR